MGYRPTAMDYDGPIAEPAWQAALNKLAPPGGSLSHLLLRWEPGDPWTDEDGVDQSVHRWVIYQMVPFWRAPEPVRADLLGPHPRLRGRYDRYLDPPRFIPDPRCNVTRQQYELHRETGAYGVPYWIIQGSRGGHKRRFNRTESIVSRMHGGPAEPPLPGELPYAPFDNRVLHQLAKLDRVRRHAFLVDRAQRNPEKIDQHDAEVLERVKDEMWDHWIHDQVADAISDAPESMKSRFAARLPYNADRALALSG